MRVCLPQSFYRGLCVGLIVLAIIHGLGTWAAHAAVTRPFHTRNQSPLVQIFGLPVTEAAAIVPAHALDIGVLNDFANNGTFDKTAREEMLLDGETQREEILLDGETHRITLLLRYGLPGDIELGLDLPYVRHSGGIFDTFIDAWHETFGLEEGIRNSVKRDQLRYRYVRDGRIELLLEDDTAGLGDVVVSFALPVYRQPPAAARMLTVRTNLKLPTGDSSELLGSGGTDIAVRLVGSDAVSLANYRLALSGSAGVLFMSDGDVIEDHQNHVVGFGSVGMSWQPLTWFAPKLQLEWHSPFYHNSDMPQLVQWSAQLTIGGSFVLPYQFVLDLGVVEDVVVKTSPDVVFHFGLRKRL